MPLIGADVNSSNADFSLAAKYHALGDAFAKFLEKADEAYLIEDLDTAEFSSRRAANKTDNMKIFALGRLAWTLRYKGLRADQEKNSSLKKTYYDEAIGLAEEVIFLSRFDVSHYILQRASMRAALALMYDSNEKKEEACKDGLEEIASSTLKNPYRGNAEGPLYNSWGIIYRMINPLFAIKLYWKGIRGAQDGTTTKANLYNNLSDAYKNLAMKESLSIAKRERYFAKTYKYLKLALDNYPLEEGKHIKGVQRKIDDIKIKKEQFDKEKSKKE